MNAPAWTAALLWSSDEHVAGGGLRLAPRAKRDQRRLLLWLIASVGARTMKLNAICIVVCLRT